MYPLYSSYHAQTYFGIVLYLFLAMALCGLLAAVAYLFSLSSVQDSEKRSEYECGFEPFDSATRLPFDVHFYLVGILFLIFDVEIALLFPWVLSLRTSGWFGFYLMLGFIFLLAIGFLYEWKRGALIWPSRQQEQSYVADSKPKQNDTVAVSVITAYSALNYSDLSSNLSLVETAPAMTVILGVTCGTVLLLSTLAQRKALEVPATAYVNTPTARIEKRVALTFKKLALWVNKTNRKLSTWRIRSVKDSIAALQFAERRTAFHQKSIKFYIKKIESLSALARNRHYHDETKIAASEKRNFTQAEKATQEYNKLIKNYKTLYQKFKVQKTATVIEQKIAKTALSYIQLRQKHNFHSSKQLKVTARTSSRQLASLTKNLWRATKRSKIKTSLHKKILTFMPIPLTSSVDSYPMQFIGSFLPEMVITCMLAAVLTFLAIELGQGRPKKELALESLSALRQGLSFVIVLYVIQLSFGSADSLFNGYVVVTTYTTALKLLTVISGRFILSNSEKYIQEHPRHLLEYPVVLTLAILFMLLLVSAGHLISAFLALVGFSLNLYVLVLFDATSAIAREAGIKYFYLSTVSSGLILYSMFLIFIVTGTGHIYEIGHFLATETELLSAAVDLLQLAVTMLLVGLFFKLSAFPGHLWAAEVYEGSPDPITAFFMLPVKVAVLAFVVQLLNGAFEPIVTLWQPLLVTSAAISLIWGCFAALAELKTKRFLAYASINQIGFLLMGVATGSLEGYRATIFYLVIYAIMNIGFLVIFLHARRPDGKGLLYLTDFRGFGQKYKQYSWSLAMILLSMAGIPPLAGFFGKYFLLLHAQEQQLYGLVVIGLVASLVSTYYYLRIIKILWFEGKDGMTAINCDLSWQKALTLRAAEWTLWVFIVHSGSVTYGLEVLVDGLVTFNDLYVK